VQNTLTLRQEHFILVRLSHFDWEKQASCGETVWHEPEKNLCKANSNLVKENTIAISINEIRLSTVALSIVKRKESGTMQTILGSGGALGVELAKALKTYTTDRRLVSRNPRVVNPDDQLFPPDLTDSENARKAVEVLEIVYLTVGLPYNTKIWQTTWPVLMQNVIDACKAYHSQLVFFDNIYMYDPNYLDRLTEETPINPVSRKGAVRAKIARMIMDAVEKENLQALIARSADFYGPSIKNGSVLTEMVFKNLAKGKKAN
jgi:nucleoside-diphosphate-sugar epimerase